MTARRLPASASVLAPVLLLLVAGCSPGGDAGGAAATRGATAAIVVTAPVTSEPLELEIEAVGTALARESIEVTSKTTNVITRIGFTEGQMVERGSVLVEFDSAEARAGLAAARAAEIESRSQYDRSQRLAGQHVLSDAQLDLIAATLESNSALVAAATARLEDTVIRAPFPGRIGLRQASVGSLVTPGTVITTLDDTSVIKLDFSIPQAYLHRLVPGLRVEARAAGLPGRTFTGTVRTLAARVDPATRMITARAELPNTDGALRPGMFMTVTLRGEPTPSLLIPEEAVVPEQGRTFVYVVDDGVAERREITIGRRVPGRVVVSGGLEDGEHVVTQGTQNVRDGSSVRDVADDVADDATNDETDDDSATAAP